MRAYTLFSVVSSGPFPLPLRLASVPGVQACNTRHIAQFLAPRILLRGRFYGWIIFL